MRAPSRAQPVALVALTTTSGPHALAHGNLAAAFSPPSAAIDTHSTASHLLCVLVDKLGDASFPFSIELVCVPGSSSRPSTAMDNVTDASTTHSVAVDMLTKARGKHAIALEKLADAFVSHSIGIDKRTGSLESLPIAIDELTRASESLPIATCSLYVARDRLARCSHRGSVAFVRLSALSSPRSTAIDNVSVETHEHQALPARASIAHS